MDRIQAKLKDHGIVITDKDFINLVIDMIRVINDITQEENEKAPDLRSRDLFLYILANTFYKVGIEAYSMEENSIPGLATAEFITQESARSVSPNDS